MNRIENVVCEYSNADFLQDACCNVDCPHHIKNFDLASATEDNPIEFTEIIDCCCYKSIRTILMADNTVNFCCGRGSLKSKIVDKVILKVLEQMATPYGKSYSSYVIEDLERLKRIAYKHDHRHIDIPKEELIHIVIGVDTADLGKDRVVNNLKSFADQAIRLNKKLVFEPRKNEDGSFTCVCRMDDDNGKS